jgi:hypothetical protein
LAALGTCTATAYDDLTVSGNTTYVYEVRVFLPGLSGFSNTDLATTVMFTDDPLIAGLTLVKAVHLTELRQSVNAVRAAAGLGPATWSDTVPDGTMIAAVHLQELRDALTSALTNLGFAAPAFTDTIAPGATAVKALHFQELRDAMR